MTEYPYPHFTLKILLADLAFRGGPSPGDPMPHFDLPTTSGARLRKRDFVGQKPLLLTCASVSCPMSMDAIPGLKRLHADFHEHVTFVTLYVREAHPGEHYPQPSTFEEKLARASTFRVAAEIPWEVAVDTVAGDLHQALDPRSNATFLMAVDGTVAFRALVSNDEQILREGLRTLVEGRPLPIGQRQPRVIPALKAIGVMGEVLDRAGEVAKQDFRREVPPGYALIRLATLFRPLPPLARGIAALSISLGTLMVLVCGLGWLLTRRDSPDECSA